MLNFSSVEEADAWRSEVKAGDMCARVDGEGKMTWDGGILYSRIGKADLRVKYRGLCPDFIIFDDVIGPPYRRIKRLK